jgi:hypothetical protein
MTGQAGGEGMKHSHRCPSCGGQRLWHIESLMAGLFEAYICGNCGISQLYARRLEQLTPGFGVRLLDSGTQGPYR